MFNSVEETEMLREVVQRFVQDSYLSDVDSKSRNLHLKYNKKRWKSIVDMGWLELATLDRPGGSGNTYALLCALMESLGAGVVSEPFLSEVSLGGGLLERMKRSSLTDVLLAAWHNGEAHFALAYRTKRNSACFCDPFEGVKGVRCQDGIEVQGMRQGVIDGGTASHFLVTGRVDNMPSTILIPANAQGMRVLRRETFDGRTIADLELSSVLVPSTNLIASGDDVRSAVEQSLICFVLLGVAESLGIIKVLFDLTHSYLIDRHQFGSKLADFQALQHRLVDIHISIERLQSLVHLAVLSADKQGLENAKDIILKARLQAVKTGTFVGKEVIQLHGAIGMTDELIVGHYFKRLTGNELIAGNESEYNIVLGDG